MASTYSTRKTALDEISARIQANGKRLAQARKLLQEAEADLTAMQSLYSGIIADINTDAATSPDDAAFAMQKLEAAKLVSEFGTLKTRATGLKTAFDGV